jgi:NAD+ kinase
MGVTVTCHKAICAWLENQSLSSFSTHIDLAKDTDVFFSVGGDGTMLRSLELIRDTEIPVIGVNTGRLGFLATLQAD